MPGKTPAALDSYDRAILSVLQVDNRTPQHKIGESVNLSTAAVQRRIRRMEKSGVIRANVVVLDPALVGRPVTLVVGVKLDSERREAFMRTRKSLASCRQVQQCYYVTGEVDFILILTVADMAEYETISNELFKDDPNVREFRTYVSMNAVKSSLIVPLD